MAEVDPDELALWEASVERLDLIHQQLSGIMKVCQEKKTNTYKTG